MMCSEIIAVCSQIHTKHINFVTKIEIKNNRSVNLWRYEHKLTQELQCNSPLKHDRLLLFWFNCNQRFLRSYKQKMNTKEGNFTGRLIGTDINWTCRLR